MIEYILLLSIVFFNKYLKADLFLLVKCNNELNTRIDEDINIYINVFIIFLFK